jgi:hypothetical protein
MLDCVCSRSVEFPSTPDIELGVRNGRPAVFLSNPGLQLTRPSVGVMLWRCAPYASERGGRAAEPQSR